MLATVEKIRRLLEDMNFRADAGETSSFARALEYIETEIYKTEYAENRARDFIPVDTSVPAWAETFTWRQWDWAGMAKIIARFADDLPAVDTMAAEVTQAIRTIGDSFSYSIQDLRAAAKNGTNLDTEKGELAKQAQENKIEELAAFGDSTVGLPGFLNNANVPKLSAPGDLNGSWLVGTTDPKKILADLHTIAQSIPNLTKNTQKPDTMLLAPAHYGLIAQKQLNDYSSETILTVFLKQSQYIRNVDQWSYLDKADTAGTGPRGVCYKRDPKCVRLVLPQAFEMLPPQARNLAFVINAHSRIGGVSWRRPLSACYFEGVS